MVAVVSFSPEGTCTNAHIHLKFIRFHFVKSASVEFRPDITIDQLSCSWSHLFPGQKNCFMRRRDENLKITLEQVEVATFTLFGGTTEYHFLFQCEAQAIFSMYKHLYLSIFHRKRNKTGKNKKKKPSFSACVFASQKQQQAIQWSGRSVSKVRKTGFCSKLPLPNVVKTGSGTHQVECDRQRPSQFLTPPGVHGWCLICLKDVWFIHSCLKLGYFPPLSEFRKTTILSREKSSDHGLWLAKATASKYSKRGIKPFVGEHMSLCKYDDRTVAVFKENNMGCSVANKNNGLSRVLRQTALQCQFGTVNDASEKEQSLFDAFSTFRDGCGFQNWFCWRQWSNGKKVQRNHDQWCRCYQCLLRSGLSFIKASMWGIPRLHTSRGG